MTILNQKGVEASLQDRVNNKLNSLLKNSNQINESIKDSMKKKDRRVIAVVSGFGTKNLRSSESLKLFPRINKARKQLIDNSIFVINSLNKFGFDTGNSSSYIIPVKDYMQVKVSLHRPS